MKKITVIIAIAIMTSLKSCAIVGFIPNQQPDQYITLNTQMKPTNVGPEEQDG